MTYNTTHPSPVAHFIFTRHPKIMLIESNNDITPMTPTLEEILEKVTRLYRERDCLLDGELSPEGATIHQYEVARR